MTIEDILSLTKAGWTKEEIISLNQTQATPVQETTQIKEEEPKVAEAAVETPVIKDKEEVPTKVENSNLADVLSQIKTELSALHKANLGAALQQPAKDPVEDFMASIIKPYGKD